MESNNDVEIGQVVKSKSGRDKGRIFLVYEVIGNGYVNIVDGDLRKLDKPKKKKIKHFSIYNTVLDEFREKLENQVNINNAYIRKLLEPFE